MLNLIQLQKKLVYLKENKVGLNIFKIGKAILFLLMDNILFSNSKSYLL